MKKQMTVETICWSIGSIIWLLIAWISYSEQKYIWVWIQVVIAVGFGAKAIIGTIRHRNKIK